MSVIITGEEARYCFKSPKVPLNVKKTDDWNDPGQEKLWLYNLHYFDDLNTAGVTEWMGQRPATPDSLPVISTSPGHPNVYYAFGHGHYGLTQGPTTGRIIADMVTGSEPEVDISAFRFDRF